MLTPIFASSKGVHTPFHPVLPFIPQAGNAQCTGSPPGSARIAFGRGLFRHEISTETFMTLKHYMPSAAAILAWTALTTAAYANPTYDNINGGATVYPNLVIGGLN